MRQFWATVEAAALLCFVMTTVAAAVVLVRPHAGHRAPPHWEAAAILLIVALGADLVASAAHFTRKELER